ncbi:MAG TPA: hypothetical protein ENN97_06990 [Phycisphaerales bacterium]|nr:hypothetical protein [Phycisphaerales bacterium]
MFKTFAIVMMLAAFLTAANGMVVFSDDFESYQAANPAGADFLANWTVEGPGGDNSSRIFNTGLYGGTRLWISNVDGTSITSKGINIASETDYEFSALLLAETSDPSRMTLSSYDLLVGSDVASAVSVIGGPVEVLSAGSDNNPNKNDFKTLHAFTTGALNPGDHLFIKITFIGNGNPQTAKPYFGVDDVKVSAVTDMTIDPANPPETMRGVVLRNGQIRTFNLEQVSHRGPNFEVIVLDEDGATQLPIDPGPVRTYRGWCEEEPDSYVEATLLPNGDLRYHVFKGNATDWWFNPPYETNDNAAAVNNFTPLGGTPQSPAGAPYPGASFTASAAGLGNLYKTVYQHDIGFDVLVEYMNATNYSDLSSYARKAENAVSHFNAIYTRDLLMEVKLGKVVYRTSNAGLDRSSEQWGIDWWNINDYWNAMFPGVNHHFVGFVGSVGGGVAFVCDYGGNGWAGRTFNGWNGNDHNWQHVARHEVGHNLGASDNVGGNPEGATVMSGNNYGLSRFSNPELLQIMSCRQSKLNQGVNIRNIGLYDYPVPPYANLDRFTVAATESGRLDVLANDYDANGDSIAIADFPETTAFGGRLELSPGTGPNGRDELFYMAPGNKLGMDKFQYTIVDSTGRTAHGNVHVTVEVPNPTLRGYWKLDETSGTTAYDSTINGNHGQLKGDLAFETDSIPGKFGRALVFDGQDDYIEIPSLNFSSNTVTITAWVRPDSVQTAYAAIFSCRNSGAANLNFRDNNRLGYHWNDKYWNWNSGLSLSVGQATFVALVIEPTRATLYTYDGSALNKAVNNAAHQPESFYGSSAIGRDWGRADRSFHGGLDDVRIYSVSLTESQIQDVIAGGAAESPNPFNGAQGMFLSVDLKWSMGASAAANDVYLGTDYDAVAAADTSSAEYEGQVTSPTYRPDALKRNTRYYWRVDTVLAGGQIIPGQVWTFTTGDGFGGILREAWRNISGNRVSALTGNARYPNSPDVVEMINSFEGPINWADNYGTRIHGFLVPPTTGQYTFWIASDDNSELWLSPTTSPSNAIRIAHVTGDPAWTDHRQWDKYDSQQSNTYSLQAGRAYYIRALHKEGGGGDHVSVAWSGPDIERQVIPGRYLAPYAPDYDWSPYFAADLIEGVDALEGRDYLDSVSHLASSFDGNPAVFSKVAGPQWLVVEPDGTFSGVPRDADTGLNTFTVRVTDSYNRFTEALFEVYVWDMLTGEKGLDDLAGLAEYWLAGGCTDFPPCGGADLTGDKAVDLEDVAVMSSMWLLD